MTLKKQDEEQLLGAILFTALRAATQIATRFPQTHRKVPWMTQVISEEFNKLLRAQPLSFTELARGAFVSIKKSDET